jgi:hypothetical protein
VKFSTKCKIAFDKPDAASRDLLEAVVFVGSIVGLHIVPYVADILRRRTGDIIDYIIIILNVILQSISNNLYMFIAAQFFIAFGFVCCHRL